MARRRDRAPPLSVNVSRMQFHTPDFVERYIRIKSLYAIPDGLLELEFTESIFFDNVALLSSAVHELRRAGIKCSIDDFGAGILRSMCSRRCP